MSQNIRAAPGDSVRQGRTLNVAASGFANISDSVIRAKPSIADPSKPIPSAKLFSSSAGAIATDFRKPRTSVNHKRTKRMLRSSNVRRTNSSCLLISSFMDVILPKSCYGQVNEPLLAVKGRVRQPLRSTKSCRRERSSRLQGRHHHGTQLPNLCWQVQVRT